MIFKLFQSLQDQKKIFGLTNTLRCLLLTTPKNLRQYYADQLMLLTVEVEYGRH